MVKKQILNDRQRNEVKDYLSNRPWIMPSYVRSLRMNAKKLDYEQMYDDLHLLKELADLDVTIGRKTNESKEIHAKMRIRQRAAKDKKAKFEIRSRR